MTNDDIRDIVQHEPFPTSRAEIDVQIATAHQYPRDLARAVTRMKQSVCRTPEAAGLCYYSLPGRKQQSGERGRPIEGPSIRLAEILMNNWGNLRIGSRIVAMEHTIVRAQWIAHDLETNNQVTGEVSMSITDKRGRRYSADMVSTTCLAALAKARRNAIIAIIPGDITRELLDLSRHTATGGDRPIEVKRHNALDHFRRFGVDDARILAAVNRTAIDQLTLDDLADLHGLAAAIRDGEARVDEVFPAVKDDGDKPRQQALADRVRSKPQDRSAPTEVSEPKAQSAPYPESEPSTVSAPSQASEPRTESVPGSASEPTAVSAPSQVSEPRVVSVPSSESAADLVAKFGDTPAAERFMLLIEMFGESFGDTPAAAKARAELWLADRKMSHLALKRKATWKAVLAALGDAVTITAG